MFALLLRLMRPGQWSKNLLIFAGIIFSGHFLDVYMLGMVVTGFFLLCLLSGCVYIINDILDLNDDRKHPVKSKRPLASGKLSVRSALTAVIFLSPVVLLLCFLLEGSFGLVCLGYFLLMICYSFFLRDIIILDIFAVACGFVLRAFAGTVLIGVEISSWLFICTTLLALFLVLSKRRHESVLLAANAHEHRPSLFEYSPHLLDQMIAVVTPSIVVTYALYTISLETVGRFGTANLKYTVPFVLYGVLRYLYLVHQKEEGGRPEKTMFSDRPLLINLILWIVSVMVIIYLS